MEIKDYKQINKAAWNARTELHLTSSFYDVDAFLKSKNSLNALELNLLGELTAKSVLHLQCHFGQDSLSMQQLGAQVTGVDIADNAINAAKDLAIKLGLNTQFICQDIFSYFDSNDQQFDVVYASYGTICWLPDIHRWARGVAKQLKAGGRLVFVEFHPIVDLLQGYSYFHQTSGDLEVEGTYTENSGDFKAQTQVWSHTIADVISALASAGLTIDSLLESPLSPYPCFEEVSKSDDDIHYQWLHNGQLVPLVYAITATKL
ncbi:bifunctional 2-polyprenyl-6-hydroxyphenol methylase/3-demethylubiquinol 3-O-methyltransferase UbiG [Paraferrimonas sp. SM1919]|uniref:class I SAM-dependent methyltransferase n=1 Tax=Paraferrimonas sp. SM1919 TaxID=2662263 RepID=UPI0013D7F2AB|nr:class I SAM-dependent methyltransferase [Paraferrimonas sp. SM1919]